MPRHDEPGVVSRLLEGLQIFYTSKAILNCLLSQKQSAEASSPRAQLPPCIRESDSARSVCRKHKSGAAEAADSAEERAHSEGEGGIGKKDAGFHGAGYLVWLQICEHLFAVDFLDCAFAGNVADLLHACAKMNSFFDCLADSEHGFVQLHALLHLFCLDGAPRFPEGRQLA